jgi:hypothetical protein
VDKLKTIVLVVEDEPTVRALAVSIIDDDPRLHQQRPQGRPSPS